MCLALTPGCVLVGLEPDEIDVAVDTGTSGFDDLGDDDTGGQDSGSSATNGEGGDGDPGSGDGDGDPDTGTGDGDGDSTSTGDGDGDPAADPCGFTHEVHVGSNMVTVVDGPSMLEAECGSPGPETVHEFIAPAEGVYEFALTSADFAGVVYFVDEACAPIMGTCQVAPDPSPMLMTQGSVWRIIVDSDAGGGVGNLEITGP